MEGALFETHLETEFNYEYHLDVLILTKKLKQINPSVMLEVLRLNTQ